MQGMGLRSIAPPKLRQLKQTVPLTKEAKLRLRWIDYYNNHGHNAALAARHFGISKSCFFKWKARFNKQGLSGLANHPKKPQAVRIPSTPRPVIDAIARLRKTNPEFSKYKLAIILRRDYGFIVSASTVGRVISRYQLFFKPPVRQKGHPGRRQSIMRIRKPKSLIPLEPGDLIEVDVKHLPHLNGKRYGFVAIDTVTKQAAIHVSSTISSTQGAIAWKKAVYKLGLPKAIVTDNGSENLGAFAKLLQEQPTTHYFARPHTPKDKPHVERFIGTLEKECLQWGGVTIDLKDQQQIINQWLDKYHNYRPHQALNYLTPNEYKATICT